LTRHIPSATSAIIAATPATAAAGIIESPVLAVEDDELAEALDLLLDEVEVDAATADEELLELELTLLDDELLELALDDELLEFALDDEELLALELELLDVLELEDELLALELELLLDDELEESSVSFATVHSPFAPFSIVYPSGTYARPVSSEYCPPVTDTASLASGHSVAVEPLNLNTLSALPLSEVIVPPDKSAVAPFT
jgi:hypothetical protein